MGDKCGWGLSEHTKDDGGYLRDPHTSSCLCAGFLPRGPPSGVTEGEMAHTEEREQQSKELERCLFLQRISIPEPQVSSKYPQNNPMGW